MLKEDCRLGQRVIFGRANGEKTRGIIRRLGTKASVETTEERGSRRITVKGTTWRVPYSMIYPDNSPVVDSGLAYEEGDPNNPIYLAILGVYVELSSTNIGSPTSPENLSCDGELSFSAVRAREKTLRQKLRNYFTAVGREISEREIYDWDKKRPAKLVG